MLGISRRGSSKVDDKAVNSTKQGVMVVQRIDNAWNATPWRKLEKSVFEVQTRIYQASKEGNFKRMCTLQRMLLNKRSAKMLAIRKVTQDNQGKKTAGVDGLANLSAGERMKLASTLNLRGAGQPVRRIWIPKPGKKEKRPLGIPTIAERARQALVVLVMEPEWEARFEPNSYGFRPGRSTHDAIKTIHEVLSKKQAYVLDADIKGCFNEIDHNALLKKLNTSPHMHTAIKKWLKAGAVDKGCFEPSSKGTPQGGILSPLLANVALHGLEQDTKKALAQQLFQRMKVKRGKASWVRALNSLMVIRYADDFVVIHENQEIVNQAKTYIEQWLDEMGLKLHPDKTRIVHTMDPLNGQTAGFDFLGNTIRHYRSNTKKKGYILLIKPSRTAQVRHIDKIGEVARHMKAATASDLVQQLSPIINGWSKYYQSVVSSRTFSRMDHLTWQIIWRWSCRRHPNKGRRWVKQKYFQKIGGRDWQFGPHSQLTLANHSARKIVRHVKVRNTNSPYDQNWVYWTARLGRRLGVQTRVAKLLKEQHGKCGTCRLWFNDKDLIEVHHKDHVHQNNKRDNLVLLHRHCHDEAHQKRYG
jgi:RNA-directed DNA polymerase